MANRGTLLIQSLLPKLRAQHPEMKIKITEFLDDSFNTSLNNEAIDLAYGYKIESSHITFIPLISERYYLLIPYYILDRYFTPSARECHIKPNPAHFALSKLSFLGKQTGNLAETGI